MIFLLPILALAAAPDAQTPPVEEIMRKVAENQARAKSARNNYVYDMNVFVRLKRANGKVAREESRDYTVAPTEKGAARKLQKVEGKVVDGKKETTYNEAGYRTKDADIDGAITDSFAREVMWRKGEFGPMVEWFPLTGDGNSRYTFHLEGEETYHNYHVYKISYAEREDEECWRGEALIEKEEFQPVLITASWDCKVPAAVRTLLGTNVQHVGAKISYERLAKDVWFPVNCGGEMKLRVLFLYARTIAFTAKNSGFKKTDVQSSVEFEDPVQ